MSEAAAADGGPPKTSARRSTLNIDLGPLRGAVDARAAADGVRPADVVRRALQAHLQGELESDGAVEAKAREPDAYRPALAAADAAALDRLMALTGARSRVVVLRSLIQGTPLFAAATAPGAGANLAKAVQSLITSNHQLVGMARNLNQIARSLHFAPGKTTGADRLVLQASAGTIREHLEVASRLAGELRPLVKLAGEARPKPRRRRAASPEVEGMQ